jgi:hypothetical protein
MAELDAIQAENFMVIPRLSWLAPAKIISGEGLGKRELRDFLHPHFTGDNMPVLVAILEPANDSLVEVDRGFIVPDDWRGRAGERISRMIAQ